MSRGLQWIVGLSIAAISGVATGLAFAPFGLWPFAFLGVAGILSVQWRNGSGRSSVLGFVYGLTFFLVLLPWMTVIGTDAWILLAAYCALWNAALGTAVGPLSRLRGGTVWVASGWVVMEALRGRVPLGGFPWGEIAFSQGNSPMATLTSIGGIAGVTFLVVWIAALTIESVRRRRWRMIAVVVGITAITTVLIPRPFEFGGESGTAVVAVVQGGTPGTGMDAMGLRRAVLQAHVDQTLALGDAIKAGTVQQPQFVVWPENSSDIDPFLDPSAAEEISAAAEAVGAPIIVGAVVETDDPSKVQNAGIVWDPVTGPGEMYVKNHPVPFGEFVPFREQLAPLIGRFERVPRDFVRGDAPGVLDLGGIVTGDVICFEVAYDDVFFGVIDGGAQLITVQTNNATYQGTGQPQQQWDISRLRALQAGRTVVVASTTGVSGFIEPDGTVSARMSEGERGFLVAEVPLRTGRTPSTLMGASPEILAGGAFLTGLVIAMYVRRRKRDRSAHDADVRVAR